MGGTCVHHWDTYKNIAKPSVYYEIIHEVFSTAFATKYRYTFSMGFEVTRTFNIIQLQRKFSGAFNEWFLVDYKKYIHWSLKISKFKR